MQHPEIRTELTSRQSDAWRLLTSPEDCAVLYGGGKGGGKSVLFNIWAVQWAEWLMRFWDIKPSKKNHLPVGFIGRKQGTDFRKTTLETFKRVIPPDRYRIREQDQEIIIWESVKILYGGLDDQERINKFNSAEFAFIGIDQAEETERTDVDVLQGSLRLKYKNRYPPFKQLYTANPADCWLKEDFIDNRLPHKYFVPALHSDNPHLPSNYVEILTSAFRYNPALLAAYLKGDWHALQATNALISSSQLGALKFVRHYPTQRKGIIACDPSLGGDECVIKAFENSKEIDRKILHERDPMKICGEMVVMGNKYGIPNYTADTTGGLGEAILARVRELKPRAKVISLSMSDPSTNQVAFHNLKAEINWYYMTQVIEKLLPYPEDEETRRQLLAARFKVVNSDGQIIMEEKKGVKKRIGRSPDLADTDVMAIYAEAQTEPIKKDDAWGDSGGPHEIGGGSKSAWAA